ncbi:MAG: hypothetical protein WKF66_16650 [Pedobacter sp.]
MKTFAVICVVLLLCVETQAQLSERWYRFYNRDSTLIGFKNAEGKVSVAPRFQPQSAWGAFQNIIAVQEKRDGQYLNFYLTKSGREVGLDSVHYFDNGQDYEEEGYIRFRDHKTDKVGLFNKFGDIVIPAIYNDLTRVNNGLIIALSGAEKVRSEDGEHSSWRNGKLILIDTSNKVLMEDFNSYRSLNLFSLSITKNPHPDVIRKNFKAKNGTYYSFIDYKKEFLSWLKTNVLNNHSKEKLGSAFYDNLAYFKPDSGWVSEPKDTYLSQNYELIIKKLLQVNATDSRYSIAIDGLNGLIFNSPDFGPYYDGRNESKTKYPVLSLIFDYDEMTPQHKQDHFDFLRTDDGYRMISLSIRNP